MSEHEPNDMEAQDMDVPEAKSPDASATEDTPEVSTVAEPDKAADAEDPGEDSGATAELPSGHGNPVEDEVPEEDATARIAALEDQVAELNDKLLRALAEAENVRRRAQRDKEDTAKYGIKNFAEGMLGVADNLGRAMASIDVDARAKDSNLDNLFVGVEMVQKDLVSTFERYGVTPIKALGAKFDPMLHEAMFEIEDKATTVGTIAQVLEPGYVLHGRTLRAAKVGITKGGPKELPSTDANASVIDGPSDESSAEVDAGDPATREGQAAYETHTGSKTTSGGNVDQEL